MCMCQVALAEHWTEVYGPKGVGFYTMHPGWVDTEIIKRNMPSFYSMYASDTLYSLYVFVLCIGVVNVRIAFVLT